MLEKGIKVLFRADTGSAVTTRRVKLHHNTRPVARMAHMIHNGQLLQTFLNTYPHSHG